MKRNNRWRGRVRSADSKWEGELAEGILKRCAFHPTKIPYKVEHHYHPDFKYKDIYIEAKGRFMDSSEASKYVWISKHIKKNEELVFLFYNPNYPMPNAKKRKDGTKLTHSEWAEKNNFRWFTTETIEEIF